MSKKPDNDNSLEADDFSLIKGIGSKTRDWLTQELNVRTFKELSEFSADDLEAQLRDSGRSVSLLSIDEWLAQAEKLAALNDESSPNSGKSISEKSNEVASEKSIVPEWETLASFVVEFQNQVIDDETVSRRTTAHHMEEDKSESWQGIEEIELCKWMLDKLGADFSVSANQEELIAGAAAKDKNTPPMGVEITEVRTIQEPSVITSHALSRDLHEATGFVQSNEPFSFEIAFALSGFSTGEMMHSGNKYTTSLYVQNQSTIEKISLQTTKAILFDVTDVSFTASLPVTGLQSGFYYLTVVTTVEMRDKRRPLAAIAEIPLFQVL